MLAVAMGVVAIWHLGGLASTVRERFPNALLVRGSNADRSFGTGSAVEMITRLSAHSGGRRAELEPSAGHSGDTTCDPRKARPVLSLP